jgi:hypothetical protein
MLEAKIRSKSCKQFVDPQYWRWSDQDYAQLIDYAITRRAKRKVSGPLSDTVSEVDRTMFISGMDPFFLDEPDTITQWRTEVY